MHKNSYLKMKWFKNTFLSTNKKLDILDVGSLDSKGNGNYSNIFNENNWNYTGLDYESGNNVNIVVTDIYNWFEIKDNSYDVVISGQFFERLEFFWLTMSQIERVLRPGGYICIIVPSNESKQGENSHYCYKFCDDGLKSLAKYVDLEILHTSVNEQNENKPQNYSCLVAQKAISPQTQVKELENRIDNLERKIDSIFELI